MPCEFRPPVHFALASQLRAPKPQNLLNQCRRRWQPRGAGMLLPRRPTPFRDPSSSSSQFSPSSSSSSREPQISPSPQSPPPRPISPPSTATPRSRHLQSSPALVEGVPRPFFYSLADMGALPDRPHKNIARLIKGKRFRKPDISETIQELLAGKVERGSGGVVVDVGANVGMAAFAAAVMGFRVVAFEPVFENLQRICDGIYLNRAQDQVIGRLDNSAISATGAKFTFKSNENIAVEVDTTPLDEVIPDGERVVLMKIDVQGWEYHVLRGASKLLSRRTGEAPYLIYKQDERLLQASNSSAQEIRAFLRSVGYNHCTRRGTDAHCTKE